MTKRLLGIIIATILLSPYLQLAAPATELKIATLSMEHIFDEYYKTKEANAQFKARADEMDLQRHKLSDDLKSQKGELEILNAETRDKSLSDTEREKRKQQEELKYTQVCDAEDKLLEFDKNCKKQIGDQMRQMQQRIIQEIRAVIQGYAQDQGISLVLDSSGKTMNNMEAVIVADKAFDITDSILAILNKHQPPTAAKMKSPLKK